VSLQYNVIGIFLKIFPAAFFCHGFGREYAEQLSTYFIIHSFKEKQIKKVSNIILKHIVKLKSVSEDLLLSAERDDVRMTLPFLY
jgi:cytoskeletal protein RodZ